MHRNGTLCSTLSNTIYPLDRLKEFSDTDESLEVRLPTIHESKIKTGKFIWQRFADFLPFTELDETLSLGEGNTPLLAADKKLQEYTGLDKLLLKNETQNPTWSFKDRGSLTCVAMAREMNEKITATISTGNMGHSIAAYGARVGMKVIIFVPLYTPAEKIMAMAIHGSHVIKVGAPDYSEMKNRLFQMATTLGLRIVSGNGPIRVEGYKLTSFEMYEQMQGSVPDYIAVPTSACGHIRGLFKGYFELYQAGLINRLPKMIIVQAANNSPIVSAIKKGKTQVLPFSNFHTVAEAITSGNPMGGDEIIAKARQYDWPAEEALEEEIIESQKRLAASGYFVEPATATSLSALKKLTAQNRIDKGATVVIMLTGSGLKDTQVLKYHGAAIYTENLQTVEKTVGALL
jgi:threonine synthase